MKNTEWELEKFMEKYIEAADFLEKFSIIVLFAIAKDESAIKIKDKIIRNFMAKAVVSLKGIMALVKMHNYQDGWVLHRCILDRLFHLKDLAKENAFELFEKWSFKNQFEYINKVRSDPVFKSTINEQHFSFTKEEKNRYKSIVKEKPIWHRPKIEDVAKETDLMFLYKYGYDFASARVHPMANDGYEDFINLTGLKEDKNKERLIFEQNVREQSQKVLVHNSCLAIVVLIQESLNISSFQWRRLTYDFLKEYRSFLKDGSQTYKIIFTKIAELFRDNVDICKIDRS